MTRVTLRLDIDPAGAIGPGKIRLLEQVEATGSIAAAGRTMDMSYRRAWLLVDSLNRCFREPVVAAKPGGTRGGGAALTDFGHALVQRYHAMEAEMNVALAGHIAWLEAAAVPERPPTTIKPVPAKARPAPRGQSLDDSDPPLS